MKGLAVKLQAQEAQGRALVAKLEAREEELKAKLALRDLIIRELRTSTSWRMTAPLRAPR